MRARIAACFQLSAALGPPDGFARDLETTRRSALAGPPPVTEAKEER